MSARTTSEERRGPKARPREDGLLLAVRDVLVAGLSVALVIGSIFWYSGTWPPMVVIESGSMMHASDRSSLGVIDTGDLTLVKKVDNPADIITYFEGKQSGYETYGNYGDVLIYAKNGHREITPIIHRAMTWVAFNASGTPFTHDNTTAINSTWDFPRLVPPRYGLAVHASLDPYWPHLIVSLGTARSWHGNSGGQEVNITVDLTALAASMGAFPHGGFLTKGDNNPGIDESPAPPLGGLGAPLPVEQGGVGNGPVQPVRFEWVVGKAQGELPWFGSIKLWVSGGAAPIPGNSATNLVIAIIVIAVGPFLVETAWDRYGDRVTDRIPQRWRDKWHAGWDKVPGGQRRRARREEREEDRAAARRKRGGRRQGGRAR